MNPTHAQHTPGPWFAKGENVHEAHGVLICRPAPRGATRPHEEGRRANARLIAAAPALYEALKAMDDLVNKLWTAVPWGKTFNLPVQELNKAPGLAKRALAQAEGRADS